jgi:CRP-like cAMP-binding protein
MWWNIGAYQKLPRGSNVATRFLRAVFRDALLRERRLAFTALSLLENPTVIQKVERELSIGTSLSRADALLVLSNLGDRQAASLLVLVHESAPLNERLPTVAALVAMPTDLSEIIAAARRSELRWLRLGAQAFDPLEGDPAPEENTMQRLLALQRVGLFSQLSLEQIEAVNRVTEEVEYLPGEIIFRERELGDKLYLLLEGDVDIVKDHGTPHQRTLKHYSAVAYFGEMAIFDNEGRTASAVARTHARLLTLDGSSLKALILQMPEISFAIFPTLTSRVRTAEKRVSEVESNLRSG